MGNKVLLIESRGKVARYPRTKKSSKHGTKNPKNQSKQIDTSSREDVALSGRGGNRVQKVDYE